MRIKKKCEWCGAEYYTGNGKAKYCSDECKVAAHKEKQKQWREEHPDYHKQYHKDHPEAAERFKKRHPNYDRDRWRKIRGTVIYKRTCIICGKEFETPFPQAATCSKECSKENRRIKQKLRNTPGKEHMKYIRRKYGSEEAHKMHLAELEIKKQKEREERAEQRRREKEARKIHGICCVCDKPFETFNPKQKTCSKECGRKLQNAHKNKRIPKEQIVDKDITLETLYRRDSGVCYLCGEKCDWNDKEYGSAGPLYPSIDHIIPIARGGLHSWDNVRLAHCSCNSKKSSDMLDDLETLVPENAYKYKKEPVDRRKRTAQYTKTGELVNEYASTAEASRKTGLKSKQIQNCARGECVSYGGYIWRYVG